MNNSTPTPPPSVPPTARLITPECQPVFPCWLYFRGTSIPSGWVRHGSASGPGWLARNGYTHWHPDQPEAPTVSPGEPPPSVPQGMGEIITREILAWKNEYEFSSDSRIPSDHALNYLAHRLLAAIAPHVEQAIQPGHTYAEWKQYQELEKLLDDTATLCRRLAHALPGHHPLRKSAVEYLQENDLMGSPLRATPPSLPASDKPTNNQHLAMEICELLHGPAEPDDHLAASDMADVAALLDKRLAQPSSTAVLTRAKEALEKAKATLVACGDHWGEGPPNTDDSVKALEPVISDLNTLLSAPENKPACKWCGGTGRVAWSAGGQSKVDVCECTAPENKEKNKL